MKAALIAPDAVDDAFRAEWRAVEAAPEDPANPFCASWFLEPAIRRLTQGESVRLLTVRDDAARLVGVAPVVRGRTYAKIPAPHFSTWRHFHGYNNGAPLFATGTRDAGRQAILRWIDTRPEGARFFRFMEHPLAEGDSLLAQPQKRAVAIQKDGVRAILSRGRSLEDVEAAGFSGKKRKELRRQWRRLGETGALNLVRWTAAADIAAAAEAYMTLERAGWKSCDADGRALGASDEEAAFFREAMAGGAARGAVLCDALLFDGRPIAMLFSLRLGGTLTMYKITYDETLSAYSPGVHLLVETTRLMLEDSSIALFDSATHADHPVMDHLWRERLRVAQINISGAHAFDAMLLKACARVERAAAGVASLRKAKAGQNGGNNVIRHA